MTAQDLVLAGSYDYRLIAVSVVIAITASYAALDLAGRVTAARGWAWHAWLIGGAAAMGIGIWSMHYTGMLAFSLPVPIEYDWPTVLLSLLAGLLSSAFALLVVSRRKMGAFRAVAASIFMGGGIVTLHYTAMAAMRLPAMCHYSPPLVALSVVLAIACSLVSLWLAFLFRDEPTGRGLRKVASATLMGTAIFAMHYTAMAAASFTRSSAIPDVSHAVRISTLGTAGIALVTMMVLGIAMLTSLVDRLQEQRALLNELFEQAPQAVTLMNGDNRVVRVNREFTRIFGYTPQETLGRRLIDLIVPTESRDEFERYAELLAHGQRVDAESVRQRKDGSCLHVLIVDVPVSMPGGKIAVYGIYHDITERKRAEEAMQSGQMMFEKLFDSSPDAIVASDRQGRITRVSEQAEKIFGYRRAELLGQPVEILVPELFRGMHAAHRENYYAQPRVRPMGEGLELYGRRQDGTEFPVDILLNLIETEQGSLILSVVRDVTERKQAEEQLRRSEAYLAESQTLSHVGSWAVHASPRALVFWSPEHYRIWGLDPANGLPSLLAVNERIHPEDRSKVNEAFEIAIREQKEFGLDFRIVLPDGTTKFCHSIGHPVVSQTGDVVEFTGTTMDVTESKRSEEALQRSLEQLHALTALLQSVREEERTRVAREIHDELGQALTAIKLDVTALVRELPEGKGPAVHRSQSILKLLDETIQSVQRISTDLRPGILDDLGLAAALEWAAEDFEARTGTKCRISMSDEDITTDADRATALFRIFQETLTNVARHAKATEVNVRLARENGNLILEVRDNGVGIREEQLSAGESLGVLGMRERARLLGGEFNIQGVTGGGTTVRVRIPFAEPRRK